MSNRFHRPELDVLRFGAFFMVFLHHALPHASAEYTTGGAIFAAVARSGALGVDLFFALSSYLITELLLREHRATGGLNIAAFYTRRILRIWPLYYFALLLLAPLKRFLDPNDTLPASYLAGFALLSGNWMCAFAGYPASSFALLWSVSIEEQFYLAWPWLIRSSVQHIGTYAWIMLAIASITRVALAANGTLHPGVWCNTLARLDPIAAGVLLASYLQGKVPAEGRPVFIGIGAAGLLVIGGFGPHDGWGSLLTYPAAAASAVAMLYGTLGMKGNRALGYLGKISFGLYVFHVAVIEITGPIAALPLTIAIAALSYRYLETPFLRLKARFSFSETATDTTRPSERLRKTRTTSAA
ncbi:MAG: acyltransferase [Bryobacteraceae bacterium]